MAEEVLSNLVSKISKLESRIQVMERMDVQSGIPKFMRGRLTLESGNPFNAYIAGVQPTLYWSPCWTGNFSEISIDYVQTYDGVLTNGSAVVAYISSTLQISPGMTVSGTGIPGGTSVLSVDSDTQITLSANATAGGLQTLSFTFLNFIPTDIFYYQNKLIPRSWTNANTRAVNLAWKYGAWSMDGIDEYRYLGTVCGSNHSGSGFCNLLDRRYVWNMYNQFYARTLIAEIDLHTYNGGFQYWNANAANHFSYILGLNPTGYAESFVEVYSTAKAAAAGNYGYIGLGFNTIAATTSPAAANFNVDFVSFGVEIGIDINSLVGFNQANVLEWANGNMDFYEFRVEGRLLC